MPNCRTHDLITTIITPVVIISIYYLTKDWRITGIVSLSYIFGSLMFNGDLDTNSRPFNRWWILKMIWIPYQLMFHHRSIFTHGIIIGTIIRIIYITIIPLIICYLNEINLIEYVWKMEMLLIIFGLELGSLVHTISDNIF